MRPGPCDTEVDGANVHGGGQGGSSSAPADWGEHDDVGAGGYDDYQDQYDNPGSPVAHSEAGGRSGESGAPNPAGAATTELEGRPRIPVTASPGDGSTKYIRDAKALVLGKEALLFSANPGTTSEGWRRR